MRNVRRTIRYCTIHILHVIEVKSKSALGIHHVRYHHVRYHQKLAMLDENEKHTSY